MTPPHSRASPRRSTHIAGWPIGSWATGVLYDNVTLDGGGLLLTDREMGAADNAGSDRPEFLAGIVLAEGVEIGDLRPLVAGHAQDAALLDHKGPAGARRDVDGL